MDAPIPAPSDGSQAREKTRNFDVSVQRSRLAVYALAGLLGIAARLAGLLDVGCAGGLGLVATGIASALVLELVARRGWLDPWRFELTLVWLGPDVVVVTACVGLTGGLGSPCYLWYLAPAGAAAFTLGQVAAHGVAFASVLAYVGLLGFLGQVHGLDHDLGLALMRMAFLYGAAFFFLRGIGRLQEHQQLLRVAGLLHDIGQVGVPRGLIDKPGRLTEDEFREVKEHAVSGERLCRPLKTVQSILPIIRHHHERIDGSGYPDRLKGDAIPVGARLLALADAYDALTSDRSYRGRLSAEEALAVLAEETRQGLWDPYFFQGLSRMIRRDLAALPE